MGRVFEATGAYVNPACRTRGVIPMGLGFRV